MIIIAFVVFMVIDFTFSPDSPQTKADRAGLAKPEDRWGVSETYLCSEGSLKAVAVSSTGDLFIGGESFITCLTNDLSPKWSITTDKPVTALSVSNQTIYASTQETILLVSTEGRITGEWGPYESNSLITSVSSNDEFVAFADATNKRVFVLRKDGEVAHMMGHTERKFIIPSPYFDIALTENNMLYAANPGMHRVEEWTLDGKQTNTFGIAGLAPEAFCGCCNPSHLTLYNNRLVTAEKGLNRIKIMDNAGEFIELVSSENSFIPSIPLDIAAGGDKIYGANPADSRLYVFTRR
ncbi:MAG: hypothetical protein K0B05_12295 [Bacteroidales bacterium]|nr:hypothetical protein [Bacteroidales bacterium]